MAGYSKLDCGIVDSSLWEMPHEYLRVWIAMLAKTDATGYVRVAATAMARLCHLTREEFDRVIDTFTSPDPESRTPDHEGCRLEKVDGGWLILNYLKYREGLKQPDHSTSRVKKYREKQKQCNGSTVSETDETICNAYAEAEAKADAKAKAEKKHKEIFCPEPQAVSEQYAMEFPVRPVKKGEPVVWGLTEAKLAEWEDTYSDGLDVYSELCRARQWLLDNPGKLKTRTGMTRYLGSWLERAQNRRGGRNAAPSGPINRADPKWMAENDDYTAVGGCRAIPEDEYDALCAIHGWNKD